MKKIFIFIGLVLLAIQSSAQFQTTLMVGFNSTTIGADKTNKFLSSRQLTGGLEIEQTFKGKHLRTANFSISTGALFLKNGYKDSYYYTFFGGEKKPILSYLDTKYLQIPFLLRLNIQPLPLVESWKIYFGAGVSYNVLLDASLYELTVEETFGFGIKTYTDQKNIKDYGNKNYLFSLFEVGTSLNRIRFSLRYKMSLQDMYFQGLKGNWKVPDDKSTYITMHNKTGALYERHLEVWLGINLFKH
jgi:hypothetical protein